MAEMQPNGAENTQKPKQQTSPPRKIQPPPAPWIPAMPYPARRVMIPHQMGPPPPPFMPPYMTYHVPPVPLQFHPPPQLHQPPGPSDENRTVWVGDLLHWMDETYLLQCFAHTGELVQVKVIRNKQTGHSEGYGFVEFFSHSAAEKIIQTFNGLMMPECNQAFRINWAAFSMGDKRSDNSSDYSIFVGDLSSDVTDVLLQETFSSKYPSVKGAKVVIDVNTGRSKGYGFVRFGDESEKSRALHEMNGVQISSRAMRVGTATPRKSTGSTSTSSHGSAAGDLTNTTLFVGGLDPEVKEDELRKAFSPHGEIASIKIPHGKQCGFVQFIRRSSAEEALQKLNGTTMGKQTVRLSWGRNQNNRQFRSEPAMPWSNGYYGGHPYDGYVGYMGPPQSPTMYPMPYSPYHFYGSQQQVN